MTIARHESTNDKRDVWAQISAPLSPLIVQWRQQGKPKPRDGKFFAPFVAYIDAQFVRERLDSIVPGEWDLHLELLPPVPTTHDGEVNEEPVAFKARLQILGCIREDVGTGKDFKTASTDAFKRAAVRFGVGHELYTDYEILWVQVDSDSKYAKPVEDPSAAYLKRLQRTKPVATARVMTPEATAERLKKYEQPPAPIDERAPLDEPAAAEEIPVCPKCGGRVWDNRIGKKNPKAPDFKCRDNTCDGVIWPPKPVTTKAATKPVVAMPKQLAPKSDDEAWAEAVASTDAEDGRLPF